MPGGPCQKSLSAEFEFVGDSLRFSVLICVEARNMVLAKKEEGLLPPRRAVKTHRGRKTAACVGTRH